MGVYTEMEKFEEKVGLIQASIDNSNGSVQVKIQNLSVIDVSALINSILQEVEDGTGVNATGLAYVIYKTRKDMEGR